MHFEGRYENLILIKQVILQCCTCLLGLNVLRIDNTSNHDFFQVRENVIEFQRKIITAFSQIDFVCHTQGK
jgi:hypothetical protein